MNKYQFCKLLWSSLLGIENIMGVMQVLFLVSLFTYSYQTPFIFEDNVDICSYASRKKDEEIKTVSNTVSIKIDETEINYKLCGKFNNKNNECPIGTVACLKNHKTGEKLDFGSEFVADELYDFKSMNGKFCTEFQNYSVVVHLECSQHWKDEANLMYIQDKCTYHVVMRDPKCLPRCTTYIDRKFIDLRELDRSFSVSSTERNFSITLCKKNPTCGGDVNACEMIGNTKTPISLASSIFVSYIGQNNQLSFHGVTHIGQNGKIDKKFEIILKCNWDKNDIKNEDLQYVTKRHQGRKYTFTLETSFGCIKKPISCVVYDQFLIYNLSGLYNEHQEMWSTHGVGNNSDSRYFLQVCGPVELAGKNTSCKSTYAQVCENKNGIDINRGSVLRHLEINNDILKATVESGMQCDKNADFQYQTFINFYCQEHEEGPTFLKQTDCITYFTWKTPHACPHYNVSSCSHVHEHRHNCSFHIDNKFYNLSELTKTQKSIRTENKEFLINICGPVIDSTAPCMKDVSVALKNLTEFNPKHKVFSLGKFSGTKLENGSLVLEYLIGSFCDGTDYTSKIRFECSDLQEEPVIIKQKKCFYEFLWRTKHACPSTIEKKPRNTRNCTYIYNHSNKSIDFGRIEKTGIVLVDDTKYTNYTFDMCQRSYTNCTYNGNNCYSVPIERAVVETLHNNSTILEFTLPIGCQSTNDFNKVTFRLICDEDKFNDHIGSKEIANCNLMINLHTNFACSLKYDYIPVTQKEQPEPVVNFTPKQDPPKVANLTQPKQELAKVENSKQPKQDFAKLENSKQPKQDLVETTIECFTKSPFTNEELNIKNLTFKNDFLKRKCPMVTFNDTYRYVRLLYVTADKCRPIPTNNLTYEVYLKCTHDTLLPDVKDVCIEHYNYEELKYCNYFKPPSGSSSGSTIIGLAIGFLVLIAVVSIVIYVTMRRNRCRARRQGFTSIYQKDTQL